MGTDLLKDGYDPFENSALTRLLSSGQVRKVYVVGIALEFCVQSFCLGAARLNKKVIAIEPLIRGLRLPEREREVWERLRVAGVIRSSKIPDELNIKPNHV